MSRLGRLWRTVRHLKPSQVWGRVAFRLRKPQPDLRPAPARCPVSGPWVVPAARAASLTGPQRWRLLSEEAALSAVGWDGPQKAKLWRYNQHYFDDLSAAGNMGRRAWQRELVHAWIAGNPPGKGTGWESYPTSLRVVNWVKWFLTGEAPREAWVQSLSVQARWLARRLEWHLLGNHLFANAKALVFAGLFFQGTEADDWVRNGLAILEREVPEQILADGGQFERSPMYHALALEDVLDLMNVAQAFRESPGHARLASLRLGDVAPRMLRWLRCMSHPDCGIAFFNDAAHGVAPPNAELERYAADLDVQAQALADTGAVELQPSGYVRLARGPAVALLDVALVGPDFLPGHAHADTLSFELSVHGRRLVVNGGTSCYGIGAQRLSERGTAAHSTVQILPEDSSEIWSGFRVGRRARPFGVTVTPSEVHASHDGYRHLPGAPVHTRRWLLDDKSLTVDDRVTVGTLPAVARYHLAPGLRLTRAPEGAWHVVDNDNIVARVEVQAGQAQAQRSQYAPEFGCVVQTQVLAVHLHEGHARTKWAWEGDAHPVPE